MKPFIALNCPRCNDAAAVRQIYNLSDRGVPRGREMGLRCQKLYAKIARGLHCGEADV